MSELRRHQFTVRRLFVATIWVSLSGVLFRWLQDINRPGLMELSLCLGTVGLFGVALGSIIGRPVLGGSLLLAFWVACDLFG